MNTDSLGPLCSGEAHPSTIYEVCLVFSRFQSPIMVSCPVSSNGVNRNVRQRLGSANLLCYQVIHASPLISSICICFRRSHILSFAIKIPSSPPLSCFLLTTTTQPPGQFSSRHPLSKSTQHVRLQM